MLEALIWVICVWRWQQDDRPPLPVSSAQWGRRRRGHGHNESRALITHVHAAINTTPRAVNFRNDIVKVRHNKADAHTALTCALNCNLTVSCPSQAPLPWKTEEEEREDAKVCLPLLFVLKRAEITAYAIGVSSRLLKQPTTLIGSTKKWYSIT